MKSEETTTARDWQILGQVATARTWIEAETLAHQTDTFRAFGCAMLVADMLYNSLSLEDRKLSERAINGIIHPAPSKVWFNFFEKATDPGLKAYFYNKGKASTFSLEKYLSL